MGLNSENNIDGFSEDEIQQFLDQIDREKESLGANQITPDMYGVGYKSYRDPNEAVELGYLTQAEKNKFASEHMGLLYSVARKYYPKYDTDPYTNDDIISACNEGMARGLNAYYREMNCTCETYVHKSMVSSCLDTIRTATGKTKLHAYTSLDEPVSIDKGTDKELTLSEVTADTGAYSNPEKEVANNRRVEILQFLLDKLHPEDKFVLVKAMGLDETNYYSSFGVADFFHITEKDAKRKLKSAQKKLLLLAEEYGYANELMLLAYS